MRNVASIFSKSTYHFTLTHNLISSTQKFHFSASSNGKLIKHHNFMAMLQDPTEILSLNEAKSLHALVITMGSFPTQEPVFLHNNIISKYASFGEIFMARLVFDKMPQRNVISYNTMITCCSRDGLLQEAFELFVEMRRCDFKPTQFTFGGLLSCQLLEILQGKQLHALIEKTRLLYLDGFAGTALLGMYGRHGCLDEAFGIFECMPKKNLVTWNSMIYVFSQMGYVEDCVFMLSELMTSSVGISEYTVVSILTFLDEADMHLGEQIHGLVIKCGFENVASVRNCLINMYAKCVATCSAEKMFKSARVKDIVSWNTLIGAMANSDRPNRALDIFLKMCRSTTGLSPNERTLANVITACSRLQLLSYGECVHANLIKKRYESDVYIGAILVNFYAKCDKMREARACFDGINRKNLVSWNSLISGYSKTGSSFPVTLLKEMIRSGYRPNEVSFSIVIKSSLRTMSLQQLHSLTIKNGYHENSRVLSSLISSYARNGLVSEALTFVGSARTVVSSNIIAWIYNRTGQYEKTQEFYARMENPDTVSWNILIASCSRNGDYKETFELFDHMRRSPIRPDNYTYVSLFSVCAKLCNLDLGSSLHSHILKTNYNLIDTFVRNTMIDMYGKCGNIESCVKIFYETTEKNVISWTALISALGLHGYANEALRKFEEMGRTGVEPDRVAFLAVLSACRHAGLVRQGMNLYSEMKEKYGVEPDIDHYVLVVDLLTRCGRIKEAEQLILGMPIAPNALIWRGFIEGCKNHRKSCSYTDEQDYI